MEKSLSYKANNSLSFFFSLLPNYFLYNAKTSLRRKQQCSNTTRSNHNLIDPRSMLLPSSSSSPSFVSVLCISIRRERKREKPGAGRDYVASYLIRLNGPFLPLIDYCNGERNR
jgi:hypothetical protein